MAIIIETCPKCGHDLADEVICTYPPIPRKSCPSCGWSWECEREEVVRVPFGGNSLIIDDLVDICNTVDVTDEINSIMNKINENKVDSFYNYVANL